MRRFNGSLYGSEPGFPRRTRVHLIIVRCQYGKPLKSVIGFLLVTLILRGMRMNNEKLWITGSIVAVVFLFMAFTSILWWMGLFDFSGTDASAKVVASAIALVGSLVGSLIAIFGVLIKLSMDRRNADLREQAGDRLQIEAERNNTLREEGEDRLKLEAAIQALGLLSTSAGNDVPTTQRAGVLFTLANLKLLDLALTMLNQMLSSGRIDSNSAVWVINRGLESNDERLQREAAELLSRYYDKFLTEKGQSVFPRAIELTWNVKLPILVRQETSLALIKMIVYRPYAKWDKGYLNANVVTLISIWKTETDKGIKHDAGLCLNKILDNYIGEVLIPPSGNLIIDKIRAELKVLDGMEHLASNLILPILQQLQKWGKDLE